MEKEAKMIGGILLLFGGFYVLIQVTVYKDIWTCSYGNGSIFNII